MVSVLTPAERLHTYTIVDAITDKNVLPFRIDYVNTIQVGVDVKDKEVPAIDTERALLDSRRSPRSSVTCWSTLTRKPGALAATFTR